MQEVTVRMPLVLTPEMLRAVREHDTTKTDNREKWHRRLGWLLCAWDVLIEHRRDHFSEQPNLDPVIAWLENGGDPKEAAKELRLYQAVMHPKTPNVGAEPPAEAGDVSPVRDNAPCAADRAYDACRSGSARATG